MKLDITIGEGVVLRPGDTVLLKTGVLTPEQARQLWAALDSVQAEGVKWLIFPPEFEFLIKRGDGTE